MDGISMNNYQFAYGDGTVTLPLVGGNILGELHGTPVSINRTTKDITAGTIERRLREHFTVAGHIFFLNCEQAQRYNILLYSSIDPKDVEPMGMKAFSDVDSLLAAAQLEGKSVYVIPNGSTVIPHVKEDIEV